MPTFEHKTDGVSITVEGRTLAVRGWEIEHMVLVDLVEFAAALGYRINRTLSWDGGEDMDFDVNLTFVGIPEPEDEVEIIVDEILADKEIETEVPHELQRPVKGPIRRLISDPEAPKGVVAPPLRVPPNSPDSEAYRRDEDEKTPCVYVEPYCDRCKGTPCICEPH